MNTTPTEHERWMMSFYRTSEIAGALFFGRLAKFFPAGPIQRDVTKHFADESMHAWHWTHALEQLHYKPIRIENAYQDAYLDAAGFPVNLMEILALTQVFEYRVMSQYARHLRIPNLNPIVAQTLHIIMKDEQWHIKWINEALQAMEHEFGKENIRATIQRYKAADKEIYGQLVVENEERLQFILAPELAQPIEKEE